MLEKIHKHTHTKSIVNKFQYFFRVIARFQYDVSNKFEPLFIYCYNIITITLREPVVRFIHFYIVSLLLGGHSTLDTLLCDRWITAHYLCVKLCFLIKKATIAIDLWEFFFLKQNRFFALLWNLDRTKPQLSRKASSITFFLVIVHNLQLNVWVTVIWIMFLLCLLFLLRFLVYSIAFQKNELLKGFSYFLKFNMNK